MDWLTELYLQHPFWVWMAIAAILLAVEVATGSGYLLWPASAAAVVALLTGLRLGLPVELLIFAGLTIAGIVLARRYLPNPFRPRGPDINDTHQRVVGCAGQAVGAFSNGHGRVFVDGKEWAAELEGGGELASGAEVRVVGISSGARLKVKAA
jgi:membrane protein implicated in regulation of membrane protease activity